MKKVFLFISLILLLVFTVSCGQQTTQGVQSSISGTGDVKWVKVTTNQAKLRQGCSDNSPVVKTSNKNTTLNVINKVSNWYAIKLQNNKIGFVPENQVKPVVVENKKQNTTPNQTGTPTTSPKPGAQPNTTTNTNTLTDKEQQMLNLVNDARSQNNVEPLAVDMELTNVARVKSQDMIDNNYFSHNSPTYGSPFDMMKKFEIKYVKAGENIAGNQSVQNAHNSLMNSPGHRKNILNPDYTHIGIGIKSGGNYGNMFTQMFISKPK